MQVLTNTDDARQTAGIVAASRTRGVGGSAGRCRLSCRGTGVAGHLYAPSLRGEVLLEPGGAYVRLRGNGHLLDGGH